MPGGHLLQFDIPDAGDGVGIDDELVAVGGGCADVGLGIEFIPHFQPGGYCVFIGFSADVQPLTLRHGCFRFFPNLRLRLTQHIFVDAFAGLWIVPGSVSSLPAAVLAFADVPLAVGSATQHTATSIK